jgi:hypothetical protein
MKKKCEHWFGSRHSFSNWQVQEKRILKDSENCLVGECIIQERKCNECGYIQIDIQTKCIL